MDKPTLRFGLPQSAALGGRQIMKNDILFWAMLALLPLIFYSLVVAQRREQERAKAALQTAHPADTAAVIARFNKIRSICAWLSLLPLALGIAIMMMVGVRGGCGVLVGEVLGVDFYRWILVGFGLFVFGLAFGMIVFRCPVCRAVPMSNDGWLEDRWVILNPEFCPSCKTRLRQ